jgi:beta-phosphoglucomutase-like phosphatase (HAD superfamily)
VAGRVHLSHNDGVSRLPLPPGRFEAYLFDCDGTIADSMPLHFLAWSQALGEWNCTFSEERFYAWGGLPTHEIIERLSREQALDLPIPDVAARKEALYYEHLPRLTVVAEVLEHLDAGRGRVRFAVVSGSARESVEATLRALGLLDRFETLVCSGDYVRSKPHPEPFLVASERLQVPPHSCLVFEDTQFGIDAAVAAGMAWVRVPPPWERRPR